MEWQPRTNQTWTTATTYTTSVGDTVNVRFHVQEPPEASPDDDGSAGVREPRRPYPGSSGGAQALPLTFDSDAPGTLVFDFR